MKQNSCCLLVASLMTLGVSTAQAQNQTVGLFGPQAHDWEFTLGGGGSNDRNFEQGSFALNTSLGYYFTKEMEVVVRQGISFADFGDSSWNGSTRLAFDYNFDLNRFRPFVGVNIGGVYGDSVRDTGAAGLEAGLKYYVLEKTFIFGSLEYAWFFRDSNNADESFKNGQFVYAIGMGFNF